MSSKFCRGSEWRKWDLHVHTPESVLNNQFGNDWDLYVKKLFNSAIINNVHVIGITDYFSIEGYKKIVTEYINNDEKLLKLFSEEISADKNYINKIKSIRLLPNIEFRVDKIVASKKDGEKPRKLNYHVIFSDNLDITEIEENFLEDIEFSYQANPRLGFENRKLKKHNLIALGQKLRSEHETFKDKSDYYIGCMNAAVSPENICDILFKERPHLFENKFILVLAEEFFDLINWNSQDHQIKKNILSVSNMIFSSNDRTRQWALSEEFAEEFGGNKPCIWGSDAHSFEELFNPAEDRYCWIKADTTFEGLLQVLNESEDRVYIGREPNKLKTINLNKSRYIHRLTIEKEASYCFREEWFDNSIEFNNGLVAIIGNKGSGKSALTDIIGLLGNSKNEDYFSFLNSERFKKKPENLSQHFIAEITWLDGSIDKKNLSEKVDTNQVEKVKYLPQRYIENICNDLGNSFQDEINKMVFSYLPEHEKLDKNSFDDLVNYLCRDIDSKILSFKNDLDIINKQIIKLEDKQNPNYINSVNNYIEQKRMEINNHEKTKPKEVMQPLDKEDNDRDSKIELLENEITKLNNIIGTTQSKLNKISIQITDLKRAKVRINELNEEYQKVIEEIEKVFSKHNFHIDIALSLNFNLKKLEETLSKLEITKKEMEILLEDDIEKRTDISLYEKRDNLESKKVDLVLELNKADREYQNYLENLKAWETKKEELIGNQKQGGTLKYYESEYEYIKNELPEEVNKLYEKREVISSKIYSLKREKMNIFEHVYTPVMKQVNKMNETQQDNLQFCVDILPQKEFIDKFLSMINQSVSSIFRGKIEGYTQLNEIVEKHDFSYEQGALDFINEICNELTRDKSNIDKLIKDREELYNYLFSLDYLEVKYKLKLDNKNMEQLSPGERGILLLIFYLVLDKDNSPLIIDQPEDNLDNQSIYKKLVPFIRDAKNRRQVIMVTHNPNIAVACDAEQIISCNMNKDNCSIDYKTGSIENADINEQIVDVLEGTMPAFTLRKSKYKFRKNSKWD